MLLFAVVVAIVFAVIGREHHTSQLRYGIKILSEFLVIGLGLAWLLYFI
jgi:hypothetical protein